MVDGGGGEGDDKACLHWKRGEKKGREYRERRQQERRSSWSSSTSSHSMLHSHCYVAIARSLLAQRKILLKAECCMLILASSPIFLCTYTHEHHARFSFFPAQKLFSRVSLLHPWMLFFPPKLLLVHACYMTSILWPWMIAGQTFSGCIHCMDRNLICLFPATTIGNDRQCNQLTLR